MSHDKKGFLISIEGIDGAGKSTQIKMLQRWMQDRKIEHVILKEPTAGQYGREIARRAIAHEATSTEEELWLFMEDRKEDVEKNILPALRAGKVVVMDRYYQSNIAYQGARGLDTEKIREENERFSPRPDLVIVLDIDPARGLSRIVNQRKSQLDAFEKEEYLQKVRNIFLDIGRQPNGVIISADQSPEKVHQEIVKAIEERLPADFFK
ncbi:dTMP kinase [Methanocella arvoryzae]|uniref:Probable thymidylate kinase n=1 Tax=Methanocella arvoryzae (strain DSM 22066 / NBRC 105507 / MRE50) TaxID=351160 RepID=Q0W355_METAR|nr:dTMP kinase [Methanocella arvoryzae]CAJ37188.1 putative thymidylate kinase [Methanocella arvoryzae MRE50]